LIAFSACTNTEKTTHNEPIAEKKGRDSVQMPSFQQLLDSAKLEGTILVLDSKGEKYYSNNFELAAKGHLPASTFKIPNTLIGLETAVIDSNTVFKWDGKKRRLPSWEKDLKLREAFHASCVPCYQELARKIGTSRMQDFLKKFDYGNMSVDSATLDLFWLEGDSRISATGQLAFLEKLYKEELPVAKENMRIMKQLMLISEDAGYKLYGKTGWAMRDDWNIGWFVGFVEKGNELYFVATNVKPLEGFNMDDFAKIRLELSKKALEAVFGGLKTLR
jgi:beta-lactamase class D